MKSLKTLSDKELLIRVSKLVKQEHHLTLEILPHLLEVEKRDLHLKAGYSSLYKYCVDSLGFSESTAVRRIRAARCARQFPEVFRLLEQRKIKIVDAANIKSVISQDNKKALLAEVAGKTQKQIEEVVAMYGRPRVVPETVRVVKVPRALAASATSKGARGQRTGEWQEIYRHNDGQNSCSSGGERPDKEYEKKFHYSFTVSEELNAKIQKCKALLSGKYPTGVGQDTLLEELTEMFLDRKDPERRSKRRGEQKKQNKPKQTAQEECSRYIGPATRDAVYNRDGGRCTYVGSNGKRCRSRWDLEIHHDEIPFAMGGDHNISNLRLLCAAHNKLLANLVYGRRHMKKYFKQQE